MRINKIKIKLLIKRFSITNHFGKNPRKGGKPPNERRGRKIIILLIFLKLKLVNIWFIQKIENLLKKKIKENEIII